MSQNQTHAQKEDKQDKSISSYVEKMKSEKKKMAQDGFLTYEEYKCYCQGLNDALQYIRRHSK